MPVDMSYYELLSVSHTASQDEIRKSYRALCLRHHPDRQTAQVDAQGNPIPVDHSKFQAIQEAYETLSDQSKREEYDRFGKAGARGGGGRSGGMNMDMDMDMDDLFAHMFGMGGGAGPGPRAAGGKRGRTNVPSRNSHVELPVSLQDCYKGADKTIQVERSRKCATCKGSGAKANTKRRQCVKCHGAGTCYAMRHMGPYIQRVPIECPECDGEGYKVRAQDVCKRCQGKRTVKEKKKVSIQIDRGMVPGDKVVVKGEGDESPDSSAPGDLCITLTPVAHPTFKLATPSHPRAPHDLTTTLSLTLSESLLGFSRLILVHLDGRGLRVTQPAPGQAGWRVLKTGDKVVVKGEGMWKRGDVGDLILRIEVEMPDEQWAMRVRDEKRGLQDLERLLPRKRQDVQHPKETNEVEFAEYGEKKRAGPSHGSSARATESDEDEDDDGDDGPTCHQQ